MARVIRPVMRDDAMWPAEVWDARSEAQRVVRRARERAREVVDASLAEADAIRTAAREEGARRGRADAARELLVAATEHRAALEAARTDIVRLALALARRIVSEEIRLAPERVEALVGATLSAAPGARVLRLRTHPDDAERARAAAIAADPDGRVQLHLDPGLSRGDCVLETEGGSIDARIDTQLAALEEQLLGRS